MNFITIRLKTNMATTQDYYLQMLIVSCKKLKLKTSTKVLATIKNCLTSVNI